MVANKGALEGNVPVAQLALLRADRFLQQLDDAMSVPLPWHASHEMPGLVHGVTTKIRVHNKVVSGVKTSVIVIPWHNCGERQRVLQASLDQTFLNPKTAHLPSYKVGFAMIWVVT
jgi:hypothetical protein